MKRLSMNSSSLSRLPGMQVWLLMFAVGMPTLWAYSLTPSPTLLNQLWAISGWGFYLAGSVGGPSGASRRAGTLLAGLGLMIAAALVSWLWGSLPTSLALPPLVILGTAALLAIAGAQAGASQSALPQAFSPFAIALVVAAVSSGLVAVVQVFFPDLADGDVIARSGLVGRAVGNLRQPNHLQSVLLWGLVALVPLAEWHPRWRRVCVGTGAWLVLGVLLSASRTGWLGLFIYFLWGALDRKLSRPVRRALLAVPLLAVALWFGLDEWASHTHHVFGAQARLAESDVSSSRYGIWSNTLSLIAQQPLWGVGWGEFNFAWTLTPFPGRPVAFFDHTHDLILQLAVEMGLPLAMLTIGLLLAALVQAGLRAWRAHGASDLSGVGARAAFMVTLMILLHSLLEYPLWYAYFLFPTAWAWGFALGSGGPDSKISVPGENRRYGLPAYQALVRLAGVALVFGAIYATWDYLRVASIFLPDDGDSPLQERIAAGQRSPFFAHHADYADATSSETPGRTPLASFERAAHALIDTRLMIDWANALAARGDVERARYLAARLAEFDKNESAEFFAPCASATSLPGPRPYQCEAPKKNLSWRDFR